MTRAQLERMVRLTDAALRMADLPDLLSLRAMVVYEMSRQDIAALEAELLASPAEPRCGRCALGWGPG
jgi:hypothetical protein